MESEDSPRAKRGGCFMCGARSPEPKREKKSDSLVDLSKLDFSIATLVAVLGDDKQRGKFRDFLDARYMGECLRLYTELESFEHERRDSARSVMAHQIFSRFIDPNNETEETVTLSAETVQSIAKRLKNNELGRVYRDLATEMLVLMAANGLGDFLHAQHVPSLSDCFSDRRTFAKFLQCSSDKETVLFVDKVMAYEKLPADERKELGEVIFDMVARKKQLNLSPQSVAALSELPNDFAFDTFELAKKECLQRLMLESYPSFIASGKFA